MAIELARHWAVRGAALEALRCQDREVLVEGPVGTGKSIAVQNKLYVVASQVPGVRILMLRKTRASMTESTLATWENKVVPPGHPILEGPTRANRRSYVFPNGSEIVLGGMDNASRILSTEFDIIYPNEATEITEAEWETLSTRLRNGKLPYQQIIGDCNPERPSHWLNQRCHKGTTKRILSRLTDNPGYWDAENQQWTREGQLYLDGLHASLTGARRKRLIDGVWAGSEGTIYEDWDPAVHLVERFEPPSNWRRVWVVDFGFTNPFVWQEWVIDPDGRAFLYREIYRCQRTVADHAKQIAGLQTVRPEAIVCDHDAEGRATLEQELNVKTISARKEVTVGIQRTQERMRDAGDNRPRLFLMKGALVDEDEVLREKKLPCSTAEEIDSYEWAPPMPDRAAKEEPTKLNDHGCDAMRYLVMYLDKPNPWDSWLNT